jgi:hypothetical protein
VSTTVASVDAAENAAAEKAAADSKVVGILAKVFV